jgi:hypothetical protein
MNARHTLVPQKSELTTPIILTVVQVAQLAGAVTETRKMVLAR